MTEKPLLTWKIASLTRISITRTFDLLISALPMMLMQIFLPLSGWSGILINAFFGLTMLLIYFIIIPLFMGGNTLGKKLFQITVKSKDKITFKKIFTREGFFILLPWLISLLLKAMALGIFYLGDHSNNDMQTNGFWIAFGIARFGDLFYVAWAIFLFVTIKIQENFQCGVDIKYGIFVVNKKPLQDENLSESKTDEPMGKHIHLDDNLPGNIEQNLIDEIEEID